MSAKRIYRNICDNFTIAANIEGNAVIVGLYVLCGVVAVLVFYAVGNDLSVLSVVLIDFPKKLIIAVENERSVLVCTL